MCFTTFQLKNKLKRPKICMLPTTIFLPLLAGTSFAGARLAAGEEGPLWSQPLTPSPFSAASRAVRCSSKIGLLCSVCSSAAKLWAPWTGEGPVCRTQLRVASLLSDSLTLCQRLAKRDRCETLNFILAYATRTCVINLFPDMLSRKKPDGIR